VQAVDALAAWLSAEPDRVADALLQTNGIPALVQLFSSSLGEAFLNLLEPVLRWIQVSPKLAGALVDAHFFDSLRDRLEQPTSNALARVNLLKILKGTSDVAMATGRPFPSASFTRVLTSLTTDRAVLVAEMATQISASISSH